jgi:16S rRNA (uracil1498-N3)-methyltransferase
MPAIHLRAPIADRDRMLWLGEKATELGVETWGAVQFRRSASVTPRGEGPGFATRLRARMIAALEQSGGAWLPSVLPDVDVQSLGQQPAPRVVMHPSGEPLLSVIGQNTAGAIILLVGPEGGIEDEELATLERAGWRRASLGASILRFETAAVAAIAVARAAQCSRER